MAKLDRMGLINSKGKELVHGELVKQVLESLVLLTEVAAVHVNRYQKGSSMEAVRNRIAEDTAKRESLEEGVRLFNLISSISMVTLKPQFTKEGGKRELDKIGTIEIGDGR